MEAASLTPSCLFLGSQLSVPCRGTFPDPGSPQTTVLSHIPLSFLHSFNPTWNRRVCELCAHCHSFLRTEGASLFLFLAEWHLAHGGGVLYLLSISRILAIFHFEPHSPSLSWTDSGRHFTEKQTLNSIWARICQSHYLFSSWPVRRKLSPRGSGAFQTLEEPT